MKWQPIETVPDRTMVLFANMSQSIEARDWCFVGWMVSGRLCGNRMDKPTHWMPLPPTPEEKNEMVRSLRQENRRAAPDQIRSRRSGFGVS